MGQNKRRDTKNESSQHDGLQLKPGSILTSAVRVDRCQFVCAAKSRSTFCWLPRGIQRTSSGQRVDPQALSGHCLPQVQNVQTKSKAFQQKHLPNCNSPEDYFHEEQPGIIL